jgi:hypothetical protein
MNVLFGKELDSLQQQRPEVKTARLYFKKRGKIEYTIYSISKIGHVPVSLPRDSRLENPTNLPYRYTGLY